MTPAAFAPEAWRVRLATRERQLVAAAATKQPVRQITQILSIPLTKNIPLHFSGKSSP
jgi:hypothetical protein